MKPRNVAFLGLVGAALLWAGVYGLTFWLVSKLSRRQKFGGSWDDLEFSPTCASVDTFPDAPTH